MSHIDPGPLATYESLADPHLTGYFNNTRMRKHLRRMGLITTTGAIVSEDVFRLNNSRKEHQRHIRDVLAQAIIHKALDMERHRQMHIKKQLEEIGKVERVRRVRTERALRGDEAVLPLLSPRPSKKKYHRPRSSPEKREKVPILQTVTDQRMEGMSEDPYYMNSAKKKAEYPNVEVDNQHLYNLDREALRAFTLNLSNFDLGSGVSPYNVPVLDQKSRPTKVRSRRPATATGVVHRGKVDGGLGRPKSNVRSLHLHRREPPMMYHTQIHTLCKVTFKYLGKMVHLDHEEEDPRDEVMVMQQHCGGENLCIFKKLIMKGDKFTLVSRRHRTFPFSLTFYLNGIQVERLSTCCEYKHKPGHKLGAKSSHFGFIKTEGSQPCFRCLIMQGKLKTKSDPTPPPTGRPSKPTRRRPKKEKKLEGVERSSESSESKSNEVHSDVQHDAGNPMIYSESSSEVSSDSESTISDVSASDEDRSDDVSSGSDSTAKDKDESDTSDSFSEAESVESIKKVEPAKVTMVKKDDVSKAEKSKVKNKLGDGKIKKNSSKSSSSSSSSSESDEAAKVEKGDGLKAIIKKKYPSDKKNKKRVSKSSSSSSESESELPITNKKSHAAKETRQKKDRPSDKKKVKKAGSKSSSSSTGSDRKKVTMMKKEDVRDNPEKTTPEKKVSSKSSSSSSESHVKKAATLKKEPNTKMQDEEKVKKSTSSTSSESHYSSGKETKKKRSVDSNTLEILPDLTDATSNVDKDSSDIGEKERKRTKTLTSSEYSESSSSSDSESVRENIEKRPVAETKQDSQKSGIIEPTSNTKKSKSAVSFKDESSSSSSESSTHSNKYKGSILPLIKGKTFVDLSNIKLDSDQCGELTKYFRESLSLLQVEKVILSGCNIDDKTGKKILKLLSMAKKIKILDLGGNKFTDNCIELLLDICQKNPVEDLSIDHNPLKNEGCESLIDGLLKSQASAVTAQLQKRVSQSLIASVLRDSKQEISDEYKHEMSSTSSASSFTSSAVSDNIILKTLNISHTGAGSSAFEKIGSYLALHPGLRELDISGNTINHESLEAVLNPLGEGNNPNLKYLRINKASLDDKAAKIIHDKLAATARLYELSLTGKSYFLFYKFIKFGFSVLLTMISNHTGNKFTEEGKQKLSEYQDNNASLGKLQLEEDISTYQEKK